MQKLAILLENLAQSDFKDKRIKQEGEELIKVSIMTSAIAFMYEKIRTIVDYNEEHLLRKSAVFRILKRRFLGGGDYYKMGENVIKELISARYLENNKLPESLIVDVAQVIEKYDLLYTGVENRHGIKAALSLYDWILNIAACEIEEVIVPASKTKVLVRFMYDEVRERIEVVSLRTLSEEEKNLQIFLAVNRSLVKSDKPMLEYLIIKLWHADWKNNYQLVLSQFIEQIFEIKNEINQQINHRLANKLLQFCRRYAMMTLILRDVIYADFQKASLLIDNPDLLEIKIREKCQSKYIETKKRLKTQIWRAIVYVFLTKMLLALIVEIPFDMYLLHTFNIIALAVNIIFPPILMILIAVTIRIPGEKNTNAMVKGIFDLLEGEHKDVQYIREPKRRNWFIWSLLNFVYLISYLVPFALIIYALNYLQFSILSICLFIIFFSIVSFFGVRIRRLARELNVLKKKENIPGEIFDFFTLPFIRLGRFLALNFSKVNIFVYFLDFLIEAPLKIVLQGIEEWLAFFKEKKEDLE
ncbi:MAG: hypothetical protein NTZ49_05600 [Candidatus Parcubacteria bacterium]|nr:hypothetical protein [Candidatus Parcubacteria bacterium]